MRNLDGWHGIADASGPPYPRSYILSERSAVGSASEQGTHTQGLLPGSWRADANAGFTVDRDITIALVLTITLGAAWRVWAIDFGLPRPEARRDESELLEKALGVVRGDLNPHFFNYPSLFIYVLAGLFRAVLRQRSSRRGRGFIHPIRCAGRHGSCSPVPDGSARCRTVRDAHDPGGLRVGQATVEPGGVCWLRCSSPSTTFTCANRISP